MGKGNWPTWEESRRRRERAVDLRRRGLSYKQIRPLVGASMASLSLWLRDVPLTEIQRARLQRRKVENGRDRGRENRERRLRKEAEILVESREQMGVVSDRDLFIAGVIAYAAEGAKKKPWSTSVSTQLINSDPRMIRLFLKWLELIGVPRGDIAFRLSIHENASISEALEYWSEVVGVPPEEFKPTNLKRPKEKPQRRNVGPSYRGCLSVTVRRSGDLNKRLDAWFGALADALQLRAGSSVAIQGESPWGGLRY